MKHLYPFLIIKTKKMKKVVYSALAVACAIAGVAATKVKAVAKAKASQFAGQATYRYRGPVAHTQSNITLTSNWTLSLGSSVDCQSGEQIPCAIAVQFTGSTPPATPQVTIVAVPNAPSSTSFVPTISPTVSPVTAVFNTFE